ncbi:MAG: hypothetical protein IJV04_00355, partial [Lachnospiraceae bacterium]|nr:hypothetical protein [Lachnospiraceae bacterium]
MAGLIDGDGTLDDRGRALIRLSSRTCVSQLSYVLKSLGVPSSMTYGDYSGNEDALIKSSFPCFGIAFPMSDLFSMSRKYQGVLPKFN